MTLNKEDILAVALVALGAYLHSPAVCVSAVFLFGLQYAHNVFVSKGKDAEIIALLSRADRYEKRLTEIAAEVMNVAERSKNLLGENY